MLIDCIWEKGATEEGAGDMGYETSLLSTVKVKGHLHQKISNTILIVTLKNLKALTLNLSCIFGYLA